MSGLGLNLGADLQAEFGGKLDKLAQVGQSQVRLGWRKPVSFQGSIVGIGSQIAAANLTGPEAGRLWHIHRITFGTTTLAGSVATPGVLVVGKGTGIQTTAQGSGQIIAQGSTQQFTEVDRSPQQGAATGGAPAAFTFGRAQFVLIYPLNLLCLWSSGTANQTLVIDVDAYEYLAETAQPSPG